jgi:hypothetical protein
MGMSRDKHAQLIGEVPLPVAGRKESKRNDISFPGGPPMYEDRKPQRI